MRLEQLNFFVEVSRSHSISLAASHLFMSQQNISTGIRKLEEELGFDLFERTYHGVELTPRGKEVLALAEEILEKVDSLKLPHYPAEEELTGELQVELVPYIALPEVIIDFYKQNPAISIKSTEECPSKIIVDVQEGRSDIGFVYFREGESLQIPGIEQEVLSIDQLYLCVSKKLNFPSHPYTPSDFFKSKLPLVVFNGLYDWTMETLDQIEGQKPLIYRADVQLYKMMVLEGLAAGFATKTGIEREVVFKKGEVDAIKLSGLYLLVCMLYKKTPTSPLKGEFLSMIRQNFGDADTR